MNKKTLIYIPTFFLQDIFMSATGDYRSGWYFKWQKSLLEFFASRKDYNFIWKALPSSNQLYDPIPNVILDKKYENVKYETNSFLQWIKRCDLVLLDYPCTSLYEAAAAKLPVFSLYEVSCPIRNSARKLFGKSLQPFSNFDEGIVKITNFLNSNPKEFIVSIPSFEISILETLDYLKRKKVI